MARRPLIAALAAAVLLAPVLAVGSPAGAAPAPPVDPFRADVVSPLLADCSSVPPAGRAYAGMHDLEICGARETPVDQPLPTEAVGGEECGDLTVTATGRGGGVIAIDWRVTSHTGPVTSVTLDLTVLGRVAGEVRHISDTEAAQISRDGIVRAVGAGPAQIALSGTVETFITTCTVTPVVTRILVR